ncbi:MAG: vWA domain-containing protein [Acidobacteriota bacterium]
MPLLTNIILFGRVLRVLGIPVTPTQLMDLVGGLRHIDIGTREDFKNAARGLLINRRDQHALFDRVFDIFWQATRDSDPIDLGLLLQRSLEVEQLALQSEASNHPPEGNPRESEEGERLRTYDSREKLAQKDFAELTSAELAEVKELMRAMQWKVEKRRTRRKLPAPKGTHLDLRATLRHNLRYGGEPLLLKRRVVKEKRRPLVVICDISGSMELYSRILIQFVYVLSNGLEKVEAFVFGTRLTRVTRYLEERDVNRALSQVSDAVQDWAGGTRIGQALKVFNYQWGRRVLTQGAVVLIISDGWDRGDIDLLGKEISRLQRSCRRLIWLNPLLGSPRYQPLTRGIQAALPHIDDFLPVHNLASLEQLGHVLSNIGSYTGRRRVTALRRFPSQAAS